MKKKYIKPTQQNDTAIYIEPILTISIPIMEDDDTETDQMLVKKTNDWNILDDNWDVFE